MKETAPASTRPLLQADALKALTDHDWMAATEHLDIALIENPAWADGWLNLGLARLHLHQPQAAISALKRGIDLDPNRPRARCTLAEAWLQAGDLDAAVEAGRDECRRYPDISDNWLSLGRTLEQMEHPEAGSAYDQAHHLSPENPDTARHWACWLNEHHEVDTAYRLLEPPRVRHPDSAPLEWQFAINCFYRGNWIRGLNHINSRRRLPNFPQGHSPEGVPLWQSGTEPRSPILLEPEQGLGDTIQFIRFIPELARRGHRVWLGCPKPLRTVLEGFPGVERLLTNTAGAAESRCRLPLMSLPSRLGIPGLSEFSAHSLKAPRPKIDSPTEAAQHALSSLNTEYVSRGNLQHKNDRRRLRPILVFAQHLPHTDSDWASLQVGGDLALELNRLRPHLKTAAEIGQPTTDEDGCLLHIEDAGSRFENFLDTARASTVTDQVITVNTAVAHLAGAMGHPTIILLPDPPACRWESLLAHNYWYSKSKLINHQNTYSNQILC